MTVKGSNLKQRDKAADDKKRVERNCQQVLTTDELRLFLLVEFHGYNIHLLRRALRRDHLAVRGDEHRRGLLDSIDESIQIQRLCARQLQRVGAAQAVEVPMDKYWLWYRRWKAWLDGLSDEQQEQLSGILDSNEPRDLSHLSPPYSQQESQ